MPIAAIYTKFTHCCIFRLLLSKGTHFPTDQSFLCWNHSRKDMGLHLLIMVICGNLKENLGSWHCEG